MRSPPDEKAAEIIREVAAKYDLQDDEILLHQERGRPAIGTRRARIVAAKNETIVRLVLLTEYGLPRYGIPGIAAMFDVSHQHMRKLVQRALVRREAALDGIA